MEQVGADADANGASLEEMLAVEAAFRAELDEMLAVEEHHDCGALRVFFGDFRRQLEPSARRCIAQVRELIPRLPLHL